MPPTSPAPTPANGRFSGPQSALYEIVLAAQAAAIAEIRPGKRFTDRHDAAVKVLAQGMLDTGLLNRDKVGTLDDVIANGDFRQFYMHRTGHWLGMDVHDCRRIPRRRASRRRAAMAHAAAGHGADGRAGHLCAPG